MSITRAALYLKPPVIIPFIAALITGPAFVFLGEADNSPGLSFIGIILCVSLLLLGVYNLNKIRLALKETCKIPKNG